MKAQISCMYLQSVCLRLGERTRTVGLTGADLTQMTHGCVTATDMCANSTDCVGVLLLLLQLQFGQTRPIDFICDPEARRRMDVSEALELLMVHA
ncbi:solute carrier family 12 member 9-like protein [Labeo rohita]|uniref:Solute carrier family 12 member 9-like protein n=1 Tax=Labeo rohita TaxID=84645 RepID=A0A498M8S4_LABRO|nr:solute carrier family 12 member 9-like protein [Labeo rohita]